MGALRKIASVSTFGKVAFRTPEEEAKRSARRFARADAKVARLAQASAELAAQRSAAEAEIARQEAAELRANLDALQARYTDARRSGQATRVTSTSTLSEVPPGPA
ncbi:hypothetical protein [Sporichthya polymorpha]|uniref:hypothetical protein n=1 Tax=Sporichthya polymorpha TaxID=35751 RepID=UPI00035F8548|nr:hypothetical protein [Sporichthya polymorpha]